LSTACGYVKRIRCPNYPDNIAPGTILGPVPCITHTRRIPLFGKVIGAIAGNRAAKHVQGVSGTGGTLLGFAAPMVIRRLGPLGLITAVAGGYAYKRYTDRRTAEQQKVARPSGFAEPTRTQA
jgi:hypothetical protein